MDCSFQGREQNLCASLRPAEWHAGGGTLAGKGASLTHPDASWQCFDSRVQAEHNGKAAYREPRYTDQDDDIFQERVPPPDDEEDGIEYYSADVNARRTDETEDLDGDVKKKKRKSKVLRRTTTDDLAPGDTSLQMEDDVPQPPKSAEERRKEFLARGWSNVKLDDDE